MEFTNISFEDYVPGLSRSNEVYFGTNAPLSQLFLNCARDLKEYIGEDTSKNEKNYKNKNWLKNLFLIADKYGTAIAKELNVEKYYICLFADDSNMAFAEAMYYRGDFLTKKDDKTFINFDKIVEMEDIVIYPNIGYKYKNSKGKIMIMCLSTGCIQRLTIEQIAGTFAHETGHCFQQGIFGLYKNMADLMVTAKVKDIQNRVVTLADSDSAFIKLLCKLPGLGRLFKYIVAYNFFGNILSENTSCTLTRNLMKIILKDQLKSDTYKMKDKLNELDNKENDDILTDHGNNMIGEFISPMGSNNTEIRDKNGKELQKDMKESFKYYKENKIDELIKSKTKNWLVNFFRSILVDLKFMKLNRRNVLSLTNYSTNQYQKISFYKKYEFFADIFATSYGFGPHIYRDYVTEELRNLEFMEKLHCVGINHLPILRALYKYSSYKYIRNNMAADEHGTNVERGRAIYTSLVKELENNPDLSENQIKAIKSDIALLKESDEYFINERKENGFWYKLYNKLVSESIIGIDEKVDEKILKPIQTVVEESIYQDKSK